MQADTFFAQYIEKVEDLSGSLMTACLGQNISLYEILEDSELLESDEWIANHVAERILFCLVEIMPNASEEEIQRARDWLFGIVLFLYIGCPVVDFTFKNIKRIMHISVETRKEMFSGDIAQFHILRTEVTPPPLLGLYDEAVLRLLNVCGLLDRALENYKSLSVFLNTKS